MGLVKIIEVHNLVTLSDLEIEIHGLLFEIKSQRWHISTDTISIVLELLATQKEAFWQNESKYFDVFKNDGWIKVA